MERGSTDWRQVFVERFKLRRAWMGGQCHVRTFEVSWVGLWQDYEVMCFAGTYWGHQLCPV